MIHFIGISSGTRSKIRVIQLILTMIIAIHWATCYYYVRVIKNYQNQMVYSEEIIVSEEGQRYPKFEFQYWIPPNDINDDTTDFYENSPDVQYIKTFYYIILLITGNDIGPQTREEVLICTVILFIGAILVSSIFGSISAEIQRAQDVEKEHQLYIDFVYYSMDIHDMDSKLQFGVFSYIN